MEAQGGGIGEEGGRPPVTARASGPAAPGEGRQGATILSTPREGRGGRGHPILSAHRHPSHPSGQAEGWNAVEGESLTP